ncbi:hypothetical protein, conserved, partial [Eimeria tenella]
ASLLQATAPVALARLRAVGLQFSRPGDYLAEMLKSEKQMGRVRAQLEAEQQQQQQQQQQQNRSFNRKFNRLSGHQIVQQQEAARRRNLQLKAIQEWRSSRQKARSSGAPQQEAEEAFDQWLLGLQQQQQGGPQALPNHGRNFKQLQRPGGPPRTPSSSSSKGSRSRRKGKPTKRGPRSAGGAKKGPRKKKRLA